MGLTVQTWITFTLLALIMGLNNIYSTLLTGWGEGGSIVAVILSLIFLSKNQRSIINYNLGQTMASAGGSVGFAVAILTSIYYIYNRDGISWQPSLIQLSLFVMSLSIMGVALAVPLRRYIVKWFFPSAVACATILKAVTSENLSQRKRAMRVMGIFGIISACLTVPTKAAFKKGGDVLWSEITLIKGVGISLDPLLWAIGIIVGLRIGASMLIGAFFRHFFISSWVGIYELDLQATVRWSAVGLMTLPAFTSVGFSFLNPIPKKALPGFKPKSINEDELNYFNYFIVALVFLLAASIAGLSLKSLFGIAPWYVFIGAFIAVPLCFAFGKVASETDINPVRLLAIILLFIFSLFDAHSPVALLAIGISGATFSAVAVDLFYDLRTGYLIGANPKQQIIMQFLGVIPVSFVSVYFLHMLAQKFGFGEGEYFPAPGAIVWATMADAFAFGSSAVEPKIWAVAGVASLVGIILSLFENLKKTQWYTPSPFAIGIALLLPLKLSFAVFCGSLIRTLVVYSASQKGDEAKRQVAEDAFQAGSAIFAASALAGIGVVLLISLGILYLPS